MFTPLTEYMENILDEAFCKEFSVYGTYERPEQWEEYKKAFSEWLIQHFTDETGKRKLPKDWT